MFRELRVQDYGAPVPTDYVLNATNGAQVGMGVVITNAAAKEVGFPSAATDKNVYFLQKERIPTGINTAYTNLPDTFEEYVTLANGDLVKMRHYLPGEMIATDQINASNKDAIVNASYVAVGADGLVDASANATSMQFMGSEVIGGVEMYKILFLD